MRLNAIQLLTNSAIMMSVLFIPLLAHELGASGSQIGIIVAVYGASFFISTYIFSRAADSLPPKTLLYAGFLSSTATFFLQMFASDPITLGVIRALTGFSIGIYPAVMILYVINSRQSIGKFSSYMPLGWAVGNMTVFIVAAYWEVFAADKTSGTGEIYRDVFALASLFFAVSFLIALTLPDIGLRTKKKGDYFSIAVLKKNWDIYFGFFLRQIGANSVWVIFPLYLVSLGANKYEVALVYMINPVLQFFIMRKLDKYDTRPLIHAGDLFSALAFLALIPLTIYYQAIAGMILIAISYSCLYVGSTAFLIRNNEDKGTAAGLLNSSIALASIIGSILGGMIMEHSGFRAVMASGAIFAVLGYIVVRFNASGTPQKSS
ncbi:MAG: MFS transporter [Candidatus Methanoperedens sp.]|nr:MFS transporter [Candidatus Methanoperedens sp.]